MPTAQPRPPPTATIVASRPRLTPAARRAAVRTLEDALAWAQELGLRGTLQDLAPAGAWGPDATAAEIEDLESLKADALHRAEASHAPGYESRLGTMLHWVALYLIAYPNYILFLPLHEPDTHMQHALHNESTLATLRVFMGRHGSIAKGKLGQSTTSDTKAAVTSTLRAFRSLEARYDVCDAKFQLLLPAVGQNMRREDRPSAERAFALGIRSQHLVQLHAMGFHVSVFDFGLAHTAIQVCARGGEPGIRERMTEADFDPSRGVVWTDIVWRTAAESQSSLPSIDFYWYPAKDGRVTHRKVPIPISRIHDGPPGSRPDCPYDAIRALWDLRSPHVAACPPGCSHRACARSQTPFFRADDGKLVDTPYMAALGGRWATALGLPAEGVGAKWARIGGATDIFDAMGVAEGAAILRQRGRWKRDLGAIYARVSASRQLDVSRRMTQSRGQDMAQRSGWAQPAWRYAGDT
jgi:hypothetical protein